MGWASVGKCPPTLGRVGFNLECHVSDPARPFLLGNVVAECFRQSALNRMADDHCAVKTLYL